MARRTNLRLTIVAVFGLLIACESVFAVQVVTVEADGSGDYPTIQAAIDDANDGDTIVVQPGVYEESINFLGKNIKVTSINPLDAEVVSSTIIGGVGEDEVTITFRGTEDPNCKLAGFSINGAIDGYDWTIDPGGENHTRATISDCILEANCGHCGTVISACDGIITNCAILNNRRFACRGHCPAFFYTTIVWCHGLIENCTIVNGNHGRGIKVREEETLTIKNCILSNIGISVGEGATLNILYSNFFGDLSRIWGDGIVNWEPGNINTDPCFVQEGYWEHYEQNWIYLEGDYHLLPESPCIDAGDPNYVVEPNETDLDGNPRVANDRIDMGAFEFQPVTPVELLLDLTYYVDELSLQKGIANSLKAKLNAALQKLKDENENNDVAAINTLEAFINVVEAQRGKKISETDADSLIAAAQEIIELINN